MFKSSVALFHRLTVNSGNNSYIVGQELIYVVVYKQGGLNCEGQ
jgi:hypothetical protein